ncbi:MAG: globin domain-containing protein [Pseudomonadota bacterium]
MQFTPEQIRTLRQSYAQILPELDRVADEFYADLFRRDPRIKSLFREDISAQGMKFMTVVGVIIDNLDDPERLDIEVGKLADGHAALGIRPEWYHTMQEALLDTFRYALGNRFTDEIHLAWRKIFEEICAKFDERRAAAESAKASG